jgi:hypothetical protein
VRARFWQSRCDEIPWRIKPLGKQFRQCNFFDPPAFLLHQSNPFGDRHGYRQRDQEQDFQERRHCE